MSEHTVIGCEKCGHLACVCKVKAQHDAKCAYRLAVAGAVGIECEHGFDVCPTCDPCTCVTLVKAAPPCKPFAEKAVSEDTVIREWKKYRIVKRLSPGCAVKTQLVVQYNIPTGMSDGSRSGWMDHCQYDPLPSYVRRALKELKP